MNAKVKFCTIPQFVHSPLRHADRPQRHLCRGGYDRNQWIPAIVSGRDLTRKMTALHNGGGKGL